jgi:hypothetical protein
MLDLRYTVRDPGKAAELTKQERENAYLIDEASGRKLALANTSRSGSLHNQFLAGHAYFLQFPNPGKEFQRGQKVTLVVGDFRAESLLIE